MAIERRLIELVGPVGGKVHTGRSRNDQVALDLQLYLRSAVAGHQAGILRLMARPARPGGTARAGRSSPATPTCSGPSRFSWPTTSWPTSSRCSGTWERFAAWKETSWMPLGAGALAGANYPLDREMVASELGFAHVAPNAMDAVAARDTAFAYLAVAASCALTLSRLAEELVLWSTQEFGLASLPESWTSGSSIMPQKRNPDAAELVRAKAAGFLARLQGLGVLLKGLPLAYNKDLQEDKLYVFGTKEELDLCLQAMTAMVQGLTIDTGRAREAAEGGYAAATDVADYLAGRGLPFRGAHRVAGRLVALLASQGRSLASANLNELREISPLFDEDYYAVVDIERVVGAKVSPGGTASREGGRAVGARPIHSRPPVGVSRA